MSFRPVTRPCSNCQEMYPHTFLGSRCPSCKLINWKYQSYVIPVAIIIGAIVVASCGIFVLGNFWADNHNGQGSPGTTFKSFSISVAMTRKFTTASYNSRSRRIWVTLSATHRIWSGCFSHVCLIVNTQFPFREYTRQIEISPCSHTMIWRVDSPVKNLISSILIYGCPSRMNFFYSYLLSSPPLSWDTLQKLLKSRFLPTVITAKICVLLSSPGNCRRRVLCDLDQCISHQKE